MADEMDIYLRAEIRRRGNLRQERGPREGERLRRRARLGIEEAADGVLVAVRATPSQKNGGSGYARR